MATTNHVVVPNVAPYASTSTCNVYWYLSRALKKAGWKYLASGTPFGREIDGDPEQDEWNGTGGITAGPTTVGLTIAAPVRGRALVTGLSGIVAADKGRFLCFTGAATPANNHWHQIEEVVSASSVRIDARTFAVAAETGSITWTIRDPTAETYPTGWVNSLAWILLRGPSTLKIPISAAPAAGPSTGITFLRGENVTQATTGAEGEILGWVHDGTTTGYLVVSPRVRGTGSGVYGWDASQVVTGNISGSTVTQSAAAVEYRHEMVLGKSASQYQGAIWHGCFDSVGDASDMFSAPARLALCTNQYPPGDQALAGSGMTFPNFAWVGHGIGLGTYPSIVVGNGGYSMVYANIVPSGYYLGNSQVIAADCIEEAGWSQDGSWLVAHAYVDPGTSGWAPGDQTGHCFMRLDDTEPGDCDPYVSLDPDDNNVFATSRLGHSSAMGYVYPFYSLDSRFMYESNGTACCVCGWRGRGVPGDSSARFGGMDLGLVRGTQHGLIGGTHAAIAAYPFYVERVATALVPTKVREPFWVLVWAGTTLKIRKGTTRWLGVVQGGEAGDTFDGKRWIQLVSRQASCVCGPWDGVTTPVLWP